MNANDPMNANDRQARAHWAYRHPWLTTMVCALLGAAIGFAVVRPMVSGLPAQGLWAFGDGLDRFGLVSATAAGLLLGFLAGVLLVRIGAGAVDCPRCGTSNSRSAVSCSACGQALT